MKSADSVKSDFQAEGISIKEWARANGFNPRTVYAVLQGDTKNTRGVSHEIAVALGIKDKPTGKLRAA